MDAYLADPEADEAWVSLVLIPVGPEPLFDDPAVRGALRRALEGPPADAFSTLVRDSSHFAGALTVRRNDPRLLQDDPFVRPHPARLLRVAAGLVGRAAPSGF